jgi:N-methylhydantoinase A/oxoprolinase/acetone carboxylase beta subunit
MVYVLGIDTGGTSTDIALMSTAGELQSTAKVPTCHAAVTVSIREALKRLQPAIDSHTIQALAISTTLATNALVEGNGAEVGLILIGAPGRLRLPAAVVCAVPGGHKAPGVEQEPLGLDSLVEGILAMQDHVDAYAVAALQSFQDPSHELVAARAIALMDPKPVFCSHQASPLPGMRERAATALANARLLPIMEDFAQRIRHDTGPLLPGCPLFLVRGDATAMPLEEAHRQAAHTAASGPAATALWGATQATDAVVVDVGGTTTDILLVRHGAPFIAVEGLRMADLATHIPAVDTHTIAVGGDSLIDVEDGAITVGPRRVTPLCRVGTHGIHLPDPKSWLAPGGGRALLLPVPRAPLPELSAHSAVARTAMGLAQWLRDHGPTPWGQARSRLQLADAQLDKAAFWLERQGVIVVAGLTPTDCLHAQGRLSLWDASVASQGVQAMAQATGMPPQHLPQNVIDQAVHTIAAAILQSLGMRQGGPHLAAALREPGEYLHLRVRLRLPVVGLGAAAPFFLPAVAKLLETDIILPPHGASGNAIGAAMVARQAILTSGA